MEVNNTLPGRNFIDLRVLAEKLFSSANRSLDNETDRVPEEDLDVNTDIYSKVLVTVIYVLLFVVGCLGNSITLYTLVTKKSLQNLQSTVHYHLASLAVSDLLILVLCMPIELYNFIWVHHPWAFGEAVCKGYYFLRDGCSYATAFNIASLSVERFMAICHPFKAKSIMSRSRTKKMISVMWLASFVLATPMLFTMGQRLVENEVICTTIVSSITAKTVLQVNAFLSFVVPMALISALNGVIASQLLRMFRESAQDNRICIIGGNPTMLSVAVEPNRAQSLRHGVMVLRSQSLEETRRGTQSTLLEVQCKVSTVSDGLRCHVICWCWSTVFSEVQGQRSRMPDLAPAHSAKATSTWFKDHGIPVPNWPANSPDLKKSMGYCEEEDAICQTQQCRRAEGNYQSNLGSHNI
ncbi:neurotensin receptor type 1 isoform X1 [Misgurnus anguillicaudatus]|uniref:neurotensin receptor type 1 isoform X1 n=1 Tax=Misgurnus anguillicaudatus TaxID=75329 RepID=UPI003CCF673A